MRNTLVWIIVIAAVAYGSYWYMNRSSVYKERSITVSLNQQNNSGISGKALLTGAGEQTIVKLDFTGAPKDVVQPAHIHAGSCAAIGGVKYPLTFPTNGASNTTLNVSLDSLLKELPLAVNVHKSASEASVYVACGDIMP